MGYCTGTGTGSCARARTVPAGVIGRGCPVSPEALQLKIRPALQLATSPHLIRAAIAVCPGGSPIHARIGYTPCHKKKVHHPGCPQVRPHQRGPPTPAPPRPCIRCLAPAAARSLPCCAAPMRQRDIGARAGRHYLTLRARSTAKRRPFHSAPSRCLIASSQSCNARAATPLSATAVGHAVAADCQPETAYLEVSGSYYEDHCAWPLLCQTQAKTNPCMIVS